MKKVCERIMTFVQVINHEGAVRLCGWLRDDVIGSLSEKSMKEIWQGKRARELRDRLARGDYSLCMVDSCPYLAMNEIEKHSIDIEEISEYPESLYLAYENVCNYRCTSCTIPGMMKQNQGKDLDKDYDMIEEGLMEVLPHIKRISANGCGELFVSKRILKLLSEWRPLAPKEEISVELETNGSLFDEAHWKQIENLGQYHLSVEITVMSFDEPTYQFLSGTSLPISQIENNLRFVKGLREKGIINYLEIATVVQERNFRFLPEFARRCVEEFGADYVRLRPYMPWGANAPEIEWFADIRNPRHPYYKEYKEIMKDDIFNHPRVHDWSGGRDSVCSREYPNKVICYHDMNLSIKNILEKVKYANSVIIVGAGTRGKELLLRLELEQNCGQDIPVKEFFDNGQEGGSISGIPIKKPYRVEEDGCIYVIAVDSAVSRKELKTQLLKLGVEEVDIVPYCIYKDYDYYSNLDEKYYAQEIQIMYYERLGQILNWKNPTTYNEIINWEKINVKDARRTQLADKHLVREWVKEQIGEKYLTKLYGVWDDAEDIDFDSLPQAFVLKVNNGSVRNIVVKDKSRIDKKAICNRLNEWKNSNFAYTSFELHYRDIVPKIICEEYLEGVAESVYDYNIYCFHGEPEYIWCIKGSHKPECQASFYNKNWEMQDFSYGYPKDPILAPRPDGLDEMLELSRKLSSDFEHVRVDWYNLPDGRVLFSEMTFSTWSGLCRWEPREWDSVFGELILNKNR